MYFTVLNSTPDPLLRRIGGEITESMRMHGHLMTTPSNGAACVINLTDPANPRIYRRRSKSVFVISLIVSDLPTEDLRSLCYATLIRTLSNLVVCVTKGIDGTGEMYFVTPEAGFYHLPYDAGSMYERIIPVASSRFATDNDIREDLPEEYRTGTAVTSEIARLGAELNALGVLPVPFPLHELLGEEDMRHLYKIFGITGASYGNLSARERIPGFGEGTFWMTGRGVNKANLITIGRDILLVTGVDHEAGVVRVSVPSGSDPTARVSVDAVEHDMIYRQYPDVGAVVHVHAWMEGILCTRQNYPCGTSELACEVAGLLARTEDPSRAVVGLKNHGLTITGHSLEDIFQRIRGRLLFEVPMYA